MTCRKRLIFRIYVRPPLEWCANPNDNKSNMKFSMNLNVPTKLDFRLSSWFLWEAQQISLLQSFDCNIASICVCWQTVQEECLAPLKWKDKTAKNVQFSRPSVVGTFCQKSNIKTEMFALWFWCWMWSEWMLLFWEPNANRDKLSCVHKWDTNVANQQ